MWGGTPGSKAGLHPSFQLASLHINSEQMFKEYLLEGQSACLLARVALVPSHRGLPFLLPPWPALEWLKARQENEEGFGVLQ